MLYEVITALRSRWSPRSATGGGAESQGRLDRGGDYRGLYAGAPSGGIAANGAWQGQQDNQYSVRLV